MPCVPASTDRGQSGRLFRAVSFLFLALALGSIPAARAADAATGTITGHVTNVDNGNNLGNARVEIEGTTLATFTDRFGDYRFEAVPAGDVRLAVFYTGLTQQIRPATVAAGQVLREDFSLTNAAATPEKDKAVMLDSFVVASHKDFNQQSISINEQRFSPTIKTVVATDQFGDITEGNVGEFVKFLPGVSVGYTASDVRNISIRGVGSQYTAIMLDGYRVASADSGTIAYSATGGGTRTTELEQISINNAARTEIIKARTPDLPADALGGSLNLISKSAFEYNTMTFNYRVLGTMNSSSKSLGATPGLRSDEDSYKVLPSFDFTLAVPVSKTFGFTLSALDSNIFNPQYRSNPSWAQNGTLAVIPSGPASLATAPFIEKYTMQDGPKVTHRKAFELTTDWKISPRDVLSFRFQDNFYNNEFGNRNMNFDTGAVMPLAYTPTSTTGVLGKGSVNFGSSFRNKFGATYNLGTEFTHTGNVWTFDAGVNYSHAAAHYHDAQNGYFSAVTYQISGATVNYGNYNGVAPQTISVLNAAGADTLGNVFDVRNPNYKITSISNNPVDATDSFFTQQASLKRSFDFVLPTTIKIGIQGQFEQRDVESFKVSYAPAGALAAAGAVNAYDLSDSVYNIAPPFIPYSVVWPSASKLWSLYVTNPSLFTVSTAANQQAEVQGSLFFNEQINAAYIMGDTKALNDRLRVVYGVRFESTKAMGEGPLAVKTGSVTTYTRRGATAEENYSDTYPSVNLTYSIRDNLLLRAAYNRAVGRPDLGNVVPNVSLPDSTLTGQTVKVSNPALKAEQADNYDLSLEYYFNKGGLASIGAFRKDFTNFWGTSNVVGPDALAILNANGVIDAQTYVNQGDIVSTTVNVGTARITGVEFSFQQSLDSLTGVTKGVSVFVNGTALHLEGSSNADFSAFVRRTLNWGLAYDSRRLSAKLNWNYRGRERDAPTTVSGVTYYEYFAPRLYLDANLEFRLTEHFGLFFNGRNLTNVPQDDQRFAAGVTPDYAKLFRREVFGTAYTFGIKGSF